MVKLSRKRRDQTYVDDRRMLIPGLYRNCTGKSTVIQSEKKEKTGAKGSSAASNHTIWQIPPSSNCVTPTNLFSDMINNMHELIRGRCGGFTTAGVVHNLLRQGETAAKLRRPLSVRTEEKLTQSNIADFHQIWQAK